MNTSWAGKTAFVTGGTGFIGGALVRRLAELGARVIVPTRDRSLIGRSAHPGVTYIPQLSGHPAEASNALAGVNVLFNLAYDFRRSGEENVALYEAVAKACVTAGVPMLVQASSVAVYDGWPFEYVDEGSPCDGPGHEYKRAKRAIEKDIARRVEAGAFDAVILQPTIVYGPGSPQWADALAERMAGGVLILPEELQGVCNGVYIDDVVEALIVAAGMERGGAERFIVSGPKPFPWRDLLCAYAEACGADVRFEGVAPDAPPPAMPSASLSTVSVLARKAGAMAADIFGTTRLERLRGAVMRLRPGRRIWRPVTENPRLFLARGIASAAKLRGRLYIPQVGPDEGLAHTQAYIRGKRSPPGR